MCIYTFFLLNLFKLRFQSLIETEYSVMFLFLKELIYEHNVNRKKVAS